MKHVALFLGLAFGILSHANDSFSSESSHFAGGAALAASITVAVDHYYPEYRAERGMIGFGMSSAAIIVEQTIEYAFHGDVRGQLLDVVSHVAGSALGAYLTDGYLLSPVVYESQREGKFVGLTFRSSF